jgi:beta-phosphoglucomutase-like phosphatase (HAD superfamily)
VAIGSGAVREEIAFQLALHGVADLFPTIVTIDDVARGKPDPETYLRCLDGVREADPGIEAEECVVFDDSRHGIAAAHAAGMRCIGIHSSGERSSLASAEEIVDRLDLALLTRLPGRLT